MTSTVDNALNVNSFAEEIFNHLAKWFPVCISSDEFHFFPQARAPDHDWSKWDDFSPDAVTKVSTSLSQWNQILEELKDDKLSSNDRIDIDILQHIIITILEQLNDVGTHKTQPSFYLTIIGIGLAEAIEEGREALKGRVAGLPGFIELAMGNLKNIPEIFRDLGCEMIKEIKPWLSSLPLPLPIIEHAVTALERFNDHLLRIHCSKDYLLPPELYERIVFHHMDCGLDINEILRILDQEISETREILEHSVLKTRTNISWQEAIEQLPRPESSSGSVKQIFQKTISELANHCISKDLVSPELVSSCPVSVKEIPEHLLPVRSSAAFSMPPGSPPKGGTFFIMSPDQRPSVPSDWRLLTAHETYLGHHLLDTLRWRQERPVRRHVEFPIFYEGWASFSEELLFDTGFFKGHADRMLIAKRRFWRAMRGRVDIDINTRRRDLNEAASFLTENGMDPNNARAMVKRYVLKPGYQTAYTVGRHKFKKLYKRNGDPVLFMDQVLQQGEIGFENLETILSNRTGD